MKYRTHLKVSNSSLVVLFLLVLLPLCQAQVYKITKLPTLGGIASGKFPNYAYGINASGQLTGCSPAGNAYYLQHIFFWTPTSGMQDLGVRCSANTQPGGINDLGHVASWSPDVGGFLWSASGGFQHLGPAAFASSVNHLDQVTGGFWADPQERYLHAFFWSPENPTLQDIGNGTSDSYGVGINDSTQIVGAGGVAWLWTQKTVMQAIGDGNLSVSAINNGGQVAGGVYGTGHAALWTQAGGAQDLGVLAGTTYSLANALNNRGVVVGNSWVPNRSGYVFVWSPTQGMLNVNALCKNTQQNWTAVGINDAGQIAVNKAGGVVLILTPIIKVAVSSSQNPSQRGQSVTLVATASSIAGAPPDGEIVTFMDSNIVLGTASLVTGEASLSTASLSSGTHRISVSYPGDVNYMSSSSKILNQLVH